MCEVIKVRFICDHDNTFQSGRICMALKSIRGMDVPVAMLDNHSEHGINICYKDDDGNWRISVVAVGVVKDSVPNIEISSVSDFQSEGIQSFSKEVFDYVAYYANGD